RALRRPEPPSRRPRPPHPRPPERRERSLAPDAADHACPRRPFPAERPPDHWPGPPPEDRSAAPGSHGTALRLPAWPDDAAQPRQAQPSLRWRRPASPADAAWLWRDRRPLAGAPDVRPDAGISFPFART